MMNIAVRSDDRFVTIDGRQRPDILPLGRAHDLVAYLRMQVAQRLKERPRITHAASCNEHRTGGAVPQPSTPAVCRSGSCRHRFQVRRDT